MKANEFVKSYGLNSFKAAMACPQFVRHKYAIIYSDEIDFSNELIEKHADYMFKASDIKRLVDSHELVKDYYGLTRAKEHAESNYTAPELKAALKQAIADVEACKEVL